MARPSPARTVSATVAREPDEVYAYVTDPRNLPSWASGLGSGIEERDGQWIVDTGDGEWVIAFVPENPHRVADHLVTLPDGSTQLNPMRVLPNGDGSEVLFTLFRAEAADDAAFEELVRTIQRDLDALADRLA